MELEELKQHWEKLGVEIEKQNILNLKIIEQVTYQNHRRTLRSIIYPELLGSLGCLVTAAALALNFNQFDTQLYQLLCGSSIFFLVVLSILSLQSIKGLTNTGAGNYSDTITGFLISKIRFQKLQKFNIIMCSCLLLTFFPVAIKLLTGKDILQRGMSLFAILPLVTFLQLYVSERILRQYNKIIKRAEGILAETAV